MNKLMKDSDSFEVRAIADAMDLLINNGYIVKDTGVNGDEEILTACRHLLEYHDYFVEKITEEQRNACNICERMDGAGLEFSCDGCVSRVCVNGGK